MLTVRNEEAHMNAMGDERTPLYDVGDYVYPTDLPRRHLCRVTAADVFDAGGMRSQILKLEPIDGPWSPGTLLIRLHGAVVPAWKPAWRGPQNRRPEGLVRRWRRHPARRAG